jgi:hypothetical protein
MQQLRFATFCVACLLLVFAGSTAIAQDDAATTAAEAKGKAVLLGEQLRWFTDARTAEPEQIREKVAELLDMEIVDMTTPGERLEQTIAKADEALAAEPEMIIVLTGAADEKANTTEDQMRARMTGLAKKLAASGRDVYVVPSSTSVGAATSAIIRIAATQADAEYVDPGSEISGEPYKETMAEVRRLHASGRAGDTETPQAGVPVVPIDRQTTDGGRSVIAGPAQTPVTIEMIPPKPLKRFNPQRPTATKKSDKKQPAIAP